jgi:hypothetical protein
LVGFAFVRYFLLAIAFGARLYGDDIDAVRPIADIVVENEDGFFAMREAQLIGNGVPTFKARVYNGLRHDWDFPIFSITYEGHDSQDESKHIQHSFVITCGVPFGFGQNTFPPGTRAKDQNLNTTFLWGNRMGLKLETGAEALKNGFFGISKTDWLKGHECMVSQELDFPLFAVEKYEIKLVGGTKKPTETDLATEAERKRIAAEEQDKKDAAEAVRQNGLAAERKRKQAAADARYARVKAEEEVKAAEERAKIRTACRVIYDKTADRKIGDLTVREAQQVQACQVLGLYSSR